MWKRYWAFKCRNYHTILYNSKCNNYRFFKLVSPFNLVFRSQCWCLTFWPVNRSNSSSNITTNQPQRLPNRPVHRIHTSLATQLVVFPAKQILFLYWSQSRDSHRWLCCRWEWLPTDAQPWAATATSIGCRTLGNRTTCGLVQFYSTGACKSTAIGDGGKHTTPDVDSCQSTQLN